MFEVDTTALRKAMVEAGYLDIQSLSLASGVNRNTTANVVKGKIYPSSQVMSRLAAALHLSGEAAGVIFFKEKLARNASLAAKA